MRMLDQFQLVRCCLLQYHQVLTCICLQELRAAFDEEAQQSGGERLLLTAAVPAGQSTIDRGYDVPQLAQ